MEELQTMDELELPEDVHGQLRRAREARGLTIDAVARVSGVRRAILASIDAGDYPSLPTGLYGRHAVRAYARAVGLDPEATVAAASPLLPRMDDPIAALARVRGLTPARPEAPPQPPSEPQRSRSASPWSRPRVLQATAAPPAGTTEEGAAALPWTRLAASVVDALLFAAFAVVLAVLTAWASAAPLEQVAPVAAPAWGLVLLVTGTTYFMLVGTVGGGTLGTRLVQIGAIGASVRGGTSRSLHQEPERAELRDRLCF